MLVLETRKDARQKEQRPRLDTAEWAENANALPFSDFPAPVELSMDVSHVGSQVGDRFNMKLRITMDEGTNLVVERPETVAKNVRV